MIIVEMAMGNSYKRNCLMFLGSKLLYETLSMVVKTAVMIEKTLSLAVIEKDGGNKW